MTLACSSLPPGSRPHSPLALVLACLLFGACSSDADTGENGGGADGGEEDASDTQAIEVAASDLIANDTTLFAVQAGNVVAIAPASGAVTSLWEVPPPVSDVETNIVIGDISLLFANADSILVRRAIQVFTDQAQPVSSEIELWRVPIDPGDAELVSESNDTRFFRGAAIHGDRIFTNSAYTVFALQLENGAFVASFGTDDDGNWVSNPIVDGDDRLWFTRNSELYRAQGLGSGDTRLPAALSVSGAFAQASRVFPSASGEDLLVWAPGAGIYQVALEAEAPSLLGFQTFAGGETFMRAARVNDALWICDFDGVFEVSLATPLRLEREIGGNCSIASIGDEVFIADGTTIQRVPAE